eukprot:166613_1
MTRMKTLCYNVTENGTIINEIPLIDDICGELDIIDYFGQSRGIDSIQFGNDSFYGINSTGSYTVRRRLFFKKIGKFFTKVVNAVVTFVVDIIMILSGDINKRVFDESLRIDASKSYKISGIENVAVGVGNVVYKVSGTFEIASGVSFYSRIYCDFVAKYKIWTTHPTFDLFQLSIGGET